MAAEQLSPEDRAKAYEDLYAQIDERILEYREMTGQFTDPAVDFVNQRALFAESDMLRRRQDAFKVTALYRSVQKVLSKIEEKGQMSGEFPQDFEPGSNGFIAKTAICLLRQQIYNWQCIGEEMSLITLYDVQASLQRQFYGIYFRQRTNSNPKARVKAYLDQLYDTHSVVSSAIKLEHKFEFEPREEEDMFYWNQFLSEITYVE